MCGIFGVHRRINQVSLDIYEALQMLQHRGQDAAGMVTFDGEQFFEKKDNGLVKEVFSQTDITQSRGHVGIGHVRYPTAGTARASEAQPFFVNAPFGIYLIHNGNLTNTTELRDKVINKYRRHLRTKSDSEILLNVLANQMFRSFKYNPDQDLNELVFESVADTMQRVKGAYAVICLIDSVGLVAFRDPHAIRPLILGKKETPQGTEWALASEDVAFASIGFTRVRDIEPGECVIIDNAGDLRTRQCVEGQKNPCIFEYIYLARPDSMIDGISVYKSQIRLGQKLAHQVRGAGLDIDTVMPVPDSSRPAALEMALELGVKYREGLVKNRYIGRTFIMPDQPEREKSVRRKLNAIPLEFKGRNILLVDDSIVRGTTMKQIIEMCRQAGAKNVYVASAAPPVRYPNVYGVDMPTAEEFIAHNLEIDEIAQVLGADALFYQTVPDMIEAIAEGNPDIETFDASCFDGKYVAGNIDKNYLKQLANSTRTQHRQGPPQPSLIPYSS